MSGFVYPKEGNDTYVKQTSILHATSFAVGATLTRVTQPEHVLNGDEESLIKTGTKVTVVDSSLLRGGALILKVTPVGCGTPADNPFVAFRFSASYFAPSDYKKPGYAGFLEKHNLI